MSPSDPHAAAWRSLWPYARRRSGALVLVLSITLLTEAVQALGPWPMQLIVDHVLGSHPLPAAVSHTLAWLSYAPSSQQLLAAASLAIVGLYLLRWALGAAGAYAGIGLGQRMIHDLASDLFEHLQRRSLAFHRTHARGDLVRRVTTDCSSVSLIIKDAVLPGLGSLFSLGMMFSLMWHLDGMLALTALLVVPWLSLSLMRYLQPMAAGSDAQSAAEGALYAVIEQTMSCIALVQGFTAEARTEHRFRAGSRAIVHSMLHATRLQLEFKVLTGFGTATGTAAVCVIGALHVLDGRLTAGELLVFLAYLGGLYGPLSALTYLPVAMQSASGSARRVLEVLGAAPEVSDRPGARTLRAAAGHVVFDRVCFGYEHGRPVLHELCLEARPGQTVALVGPSGAGKSTLLSLIPRFSDVWSGQLCIDGYDVRDLRLASLRAHVSLVLQDSFLFPMSIADNIAYGCLSATREAVEAAARAARADSFIRALPAGYDTLIGERGARLSGGERQRIAIARAALKRAPVLLLDEPTSALDVETEQEVMLALRALMQDRTTFVIAHRLSTVQNADQIVLLENGRVVETGAPAQLLAEGGRFARFHAAQLDNRKGGHDASHAQSSR